ncbi:MAG: TIGR02281 family clan AA aspartic protease [Gammaproteobacteria bacterium]|nr:MAG: TIGR02281 family clan AA aspartic protease [Gammaproteobacteria bacterium]
MESPTPPSLSKMTIAIIWIVLLLITTLLFNTLLKDINNPNQQLTVSINEFGEQQVVLKQNRYGHYLASGEINGQTVEFLVDTGATLVAIPQHIAEKLQLKKGYQFESQTANGSSTSYLTKIDTLSLGGIVMENVPASISSGMEFDEILLGMSFLKHLKITQQGKELRLSLP